jgi:hypothetical protein
VSWIKVIGVLLIFTFAGIYGWLWWLTSTASVSTHGTVDLRPGNISVPSVRSNFDRGSSNLTDSLIDSWANWEFLDWQEEGKVTMPRVLLAKLARGRDVAAVNQYLLEAKVRGTVGSTSLFHPEGDYDFTLAGLTLLLYTFGESPELLYPDTVDHIVNVLMTEEGGSPVEFTPRILGLPLRDTENHILMTEGSRYLKNRWLRLQGNSDLKFNNVENGLEAFLLEHLAHMERAGFHEYNSRPYIGYTLTALLNLQSFADRPVSEAATRILDRANWEYALGSFDYRRFPPFRRQPERAADTDLDGDYHTAMIKAWMSLRDAGRDARRVRIRSGDHHALWVPFTSYRLPEVTSEWIERKSREYLIMMGHGADGSPEIYSSGPSFLISAGGVARDRFKQAVARPTTLMLDDGVLELAGILHIIGEDDDYRQWNNTGVYNRFAVGKRVVLPASWLPVASQGRWSVYEPNASARDSVRNLVRNSVHNSSYNPTHNPAKVLIYTGQDVALFYLMPNFDSGLLLDIMTEKNSDEALLLDQFTTYYDEVIRYDIDAPKDTWVIESVSGVAINRNFDSWALLEGELAP